MNEKILKNIDYIASIAGLEGYQLTLTRFVKFLYLAEILYLKHSKERLTDWDWIFWDYGPYCSESLGALDFAIQKTIISSANYQSKFSEETEFQLIGYPKDQYSYQADLEKHVVQLEKDIPIMVQMGMKSYIKKYGNNTHDLLNYVYFKTEPMKVASPRAKINFDVISNQQSEQIEQNNISRKNEKKIREAIARMKTKMLTKNVVKLCIKSTDIDTDYITGMEALNRLDENENINETGFASIQSISKD